MPDSIFNPAAKLALDPLNTKINPLLIIFASHGIPVRTMKYGEKGVHEAGIWTPGGIWGDSVKGWKGSLILFQMAMVAMDMLQIAFLPWQNGGPLTIEAICKDNSTIAIKMNDQFIYAHFDIDHSPKIKGEGGVFHSR